MPAETAVPHHSVVIVGAGQAGLSASWFLKRRGIDHVLFEKNRIGHAWRTERWDSFCLVTPNWQCQLPGFPYPGNDPHGFMLKDEIVAYVEAYAALVGAPVREGVAVTEVIRGQDGLYRVETSEGPVSADAVIVAAGGYHVPFIPRIAERLPPAIMQVHSAAYRSPHALPPGDVVVIGSGQSGCQIAEDLHLAGRRVHLSVGSAPRSPRLYRGRDAIDWLADMGYYDLPVEKHPLGDKVRAKANHYLTGRDGGREIDLRRFAREGMQLYGRLATIDGGRFAFDDDLGRQLDSADSVYVGIRGVIDTYIADKGIAAPEEPPFVPCWAPGPDHPRSLDLATVPVGAIIWCTGFRTNYSWLSVPVFDGRGYPAHRRGVTPVQGLYVLGLPWLHTWGSGRFSGIARDAEHVVDHLAGEIGRDASEPRLALVS